MSSSNADIGILANEPRPRPNNDGSTFHEPQIITSRTDVYESMAQTTEFCGNCCYADIADGSTTSPALPPIIGLRISGVLGNVPLPLAGDHADKIKSAIINEKNGGKKFGSVYEIEANKIKIQNPQWGKSLGELLRTVAFKLGVNPRHLSALPKTLTLMEQGGYIGRIWDDDDEDDNVIGSLFIQLPSKFTGGELTIYNSLEEDRDEESFKFTLGAGEEATYSCHFVCHFSDCDYEMAKLHTGSRLLLCYSLRYKEADPLPTAGLIREKTSLIACSLKGLPPADRIVVVPLKERYPDHSLANSGINTLNIEHRQKAEALKAARPNWVLLIVKAKLIHTCGYFDACTTVTSVREIYDELGNNVTSEMSWLSRSVDFECVDEDGMMLAAPHDDEAEECVSRAHWGEQLETDYHCDDQSFFMATFLVSYDPAVKPELKCLGGYEEVAEVIEIIVNTQDYDLLDRVLAVVESKEKSKFDVKSCQMLLQMLIKSKKDTPTLVTLANKILRGLSSSEEPDKQLYDTIIGIVEKFGYVQLHESIQQLFADVKRKRGKGICVFLKRMDFALRVKKHIEEGGPNYLEDAITDLNEHSPTSSWQVDSAAVVKSIKDMISNHKQQRHGLTSVVQASLTFLHNVSIRNLGSLSLLMNRMLLLKHLMDQKMFGSLQTPITDFAADFMQGLPSVIERKSKELDSKLKGDEKGTFVVATAIVIKYGTQNHWKRFGELIIKKKSIFFALIAAIMSYVKGEILLRDILNNCLVRCYISYSTSDWNRGLPFSPNNATLHIQKLLELSPSVARRLDKNMRLPLHYAAASDIRSSNITFEIVRRVFNAYKPAATMRDPITKLYPFQLAASNNNYKASFSLLLENPNLVASAINVPKSRGRKRKRKQKSSA